MPESTWVDHLHLSMGTFLCVQTLIISGFQSRQFGFVYYFANIHLLQYIPAQLIRRPIFNNFKSVSTGQPLLEQHNVILNQNDSCSDDDIVARHLLFCWLWAINNKKQPILTIEGTKMTLRCPPTFWLALS